MVRQLSCSGFGLTAWYTHVTQRNPSAWLWGIPQKGAAMRHSKLAIVLVLLSFGCGHKPGLLPPKSGHRRWVTADVKFMVPHRPAGSVRALVRSPLPDEGFSDCRGIGSTYRCSLPAHSSGTVIVVVLRNSEIYCEPVRAATWNGQQMTDNVVRGEDGASCDHELAVVTK